MIPRRYKAWLVAALIVVATVSVLTAVHDGQGVDRIVEAETRANGRLVPPVVAALWPRHGETLASLRQAPSTLLRNHPVQAVIGKALDQLLAAQPAILRIDLLTTSGRTLFSTDPTAIGHVQSDSPEFLAARNGQAAG